MMMYFAFFFFFFFKFIECVRTSTGEDVPEGDIIDASEAPVDGVGVVVVVVVVVVVAIAAGGVDGGLLDALLISRRPNGVADEGDGVVEAESKDDS